MKSVLSHMSIRVVAPILLVLPMLLAAGVLIAISAIQGRAAVERLASQQLAQIHAQINQHVESLVSLPGRANRANVALLNSKHFDPNEPRSWGPILIEQFLAFEALSAITWGGEDGQCTWIARYVGDDEHLYYAIKDKVTGDRIVEYRVNSDGRISMNPADSFPFDPRGRPWYVAPANAGRPAWSEPFLWVGGSDEQQATLGIAFGWPYYDGDGKLVGVIDADLSLSDISRYLAALQIGRTGRAYVVDDQGLMLAASTRAALTDHAGVRLAASSSSDEWIRGSSQRLSELFGSVGSVDRDHEEIVEIGGRREWLRVSPFTHETGLNWVIVTLVPETDFMSEITAGRRRSAWFTAGVTLGTLGLGVLLAMLFAKPIVELTQHVRRLGEGELDREIKLPYTREFAHLSNDINLMAVNLRDLMELRRSLALAMEVQQNLLPTKTPRIAGLDVAGHSTYCDETGGDYFDYLEIAELSDRAVALVVGDVAGHGIAAAILMATARGILRSRCTESGSLGDLLGHLNDLLVEVTGGSRFMTMVLITIDCDRDELRMSSAGHDSPFIYDPGSDTFIELEAGGLPLGILVSEKYPEATYRPIPPGCVILASTDGLWEAQNEEEKQFGKDRVREILRANACHGSHTIAMALRDGLQTFCGKARQLDDITFVVARRLDPADL